LYLFLSALYINAIIFKASSDKTLLNVISLITNRTNRTNRKYYFCCKQYLSIQENIL